MISGTGCEAQICLAVWVGADNIVDAGLQLAIPASAGWPDAGWDGGSLSVDDVKGNKTVGQAVVLMLAALNDRMICVSLPTVSITSNMRGLGVVNPGPSWRRRCGIALLLVLDFHRGESRGSWRGHRRGRHLGLFLCRLGQGRPLHRQRLLSTPCWPVLSPPPW